MVEAGRSVVTNLQKCRQSETSVTNQTLRFKKEETTSAKSSTPPPYFRSAMNEFRGGGDIYI